MIENRAYSTREWRRAVNTFAILGWFFVSVPLIYEAGIGMLPWIAVIGLPIAFISCWVIAAPILWRIMRKSISWPLAMFWGAVISATMAAIRIIVGRLNGLRISRDPSHYFQIGSGEFTREIDGILTAYGWWVLFQNTALFILAGAISGLIIRAIIGCGAKQ